MTPDLRRWWPALPALVIAWFGAESFLEKYPRPAGASRGMAAAARGPDSLLEGFRREMDAERSGHPGDTLASARPLDNPFRPIRPDRPARNAGPGTPAAPPPPRDFHLNGTIGSKVATITSNSGGKVIVKVGDRVDSATVLSIETNKVMLRDRAGKFEILLER